MQRLYDKGHDYTRLKKRIRENREDERMFAVGVRKLKYDRRYI